MNEFWKFTIVFVISWACNFGVAMLAYGLGERKTLSIQNPHISALYSELELTREELAAAILERDHYKTMAESRQRAELDEYVERLR